AFGPESIQPSPFVFSAFRCKQLSLWVARRSPRAPIAREGKRGQVLALKEMVQVAWRKNDLFTESLHGFPRCCRFESSNCTRHMEFGSGARQRRTLKVRFGATDEAVPSSIAILDALRDSPGPT